MKRLNEIKHFEIKCPVCGNTDFVLLKEDNPSWFKDQSYAVGCTKCFLTLRYNPSPVYVALKIEEQRKKQIAQIDDLNEAIAKLEIESHQALEKIEALKVKKSNFKDVNEYWEQLESLRKEKDDIDYRITLHRQELKAIEDEMERDEDWGYDVEVL